MLPATGHAHALKTTYIFPVGVFKVLINVAL